MPALPRLDVPPSIARRFGDVDPEEARAVAEFIDRKRPRKQSVDAALEFYGLDHGFGKWKGYKLLKAGRVLAAMLEKKGVNKIYGERYQQGMVRRR